MSGVLLTAFGCQLNLSQVPRAGKATCFGVHSSEEHFPIADDTKCLLPQQTGTGIYSPALEGPVGEAAGQQGKRVHVGRPGLCQLQGERFWERHLIPASQFAQVNNKGVG